MKGEEGGSVRSSEGGKEKMVGGGGFYINSDAY